MRTLKLPENWRMVPLSACLERNDSGTWGDEPLYEGNDYPILRSTNIQDNRMTFKNVAMRSLNSSSAQRYELFSGDILVTKASGSLHLIGKSAIFIHPGDQKTYLFSNFTQRLRCNSEIIIHEYLAYYLKSFLAQQYLEQMHSTTSGLRNLDMRVYASQVLPLPPLAEQRRIVEILSLAEEICDDRRRILEGGWVERDGEKERVWGAKDLLPALFQEMFGEPKTNPKGWPQIRVGDAGDVQLGRQRSPQYQTGQYSHSYIRVANVFEDRIDTNDILQMDFDERDFANFKLGYGDILLNEGQSTELVGRPAMWRNEIEDCCFQNTLIRFRSKTDSLLPEFSLSLFLYYYRCGEFSRISSKTSSIAHLGASRFASLPFILPPKEIQERFAEQGILARLIYADAGSESIETDKLLQSLNAKAFLGELTATWRGGSEALEPVMVPRRAVEEIDEPEYDDETPWLLSGIEDDYESNVKWFNEPDEDPGDIESFFYLFMLPRWREHEPLVAERPEALSEIKNSIEELILAGITDNPSQYWTAELLSQRRPLVRNEIPVIRRALETLTEMGLIMAVAKEVPMRFVSDKSSYVVVYRAVRDDERRTA